MSGQSEIHESKEKDSSTQSFWQIYWINSYGIMKATINQACARERERFRKKKVIYEYMRLCETTIQPEHKMHQTAKV